MVLVVLPSILLYLRDMDLTASKSLNFDNSYARLPKHWYQSIAPTPLKSSCFISLNTKLAAEIGLDFKNWNEDSIVKCFGGESLPDFSEPLAMKYAGYQFGIYNPDLGDGRGILIGEHLSPDGTRWDLHLKGSGKTAYSRFADGKALLRSSIREYLVSEAMNGLSVPTSRALCLLGSDERTYRNGMELCGQIVRVTPCHIRFGHFEHFYYQGLHEDLKLLADYVLDRYYPGCENHSQPYLALFNEILRRSAKLVALWQACGFVHGVLNTDNMSIIGESFDYGPFTFMDSYESGYISNKNDDKGRYAFSKQPAVVEWNLAALAETFTPLVEKELLENSLASFESSYQKYFYERMRCRLGLGNSDREANELIDKLLESLECGRGDLNRFLFWLMDYRGEGEIDQSAGQDSKISDIVNRLIKLRDSSGNEKIKALSRDYNPRYTLRNYMLQEAIYDAEQGDYERVKRLLEMVSMPAADCPQFPEYEAAPPSWANAIFLTCSS